MSVTLEELERIAMGMLETHGKEVYGLASTLHLAVGMLRTVQASNGIDLEHHVALLERACNVYAEHIGLAPGSVAAARRDIEQSAQTVNILNTI